ncbi:glycerol-3-phosphate dehydrogenase/oxidase [candidate division KSB1 bacterium]|nr:glycerol-3-phosphate dehydrogenase/oxidase [candidate division KSB1 bacterium]
MNRNDMLKTIKAPPHHWDFIIIGGGATGLGTAVDAASRGYKTLLLEQHDFAKGTSSRSTKLIHGGVRYLAQGNISLVLEALRERGLLLRNAPHLVHNQSFVVPSYDWWEGPFYGIGMKVYDVLAGKLGLGPSKILSREETLARIPTLEPNGLRGGVIYHDGQFDDARLAINLAQTIVDLGGTAINYMQVTSLLKSHGLISGVVAQDVETGETHELKASVVINATGAYTDSIRRLDDPTADAIIAPSQGVHLVLDKSFLPGDSAIMVPHTDDGRVLFVVPWHDRAIVGTTDTPIDDVPLEPRPLQEEIEFLLTHAGRYLTKDPTTNDVKSIFAGIRPLVKAGEEKDTAALARDHTILISKSGLLTITGGKWTTYRKMAEDTVNQAAILAGLDERPCVTETLRLHGWLENAEAENPFSVYGADWIGVQKILQENSAFAQRLHVDLPYFAAEVIWAARNEMARTVEDVLSRRTRALLLDAKASIEIAPKVAALMARDLGYNEHWQKQQVANYRDLANGYIIDGSEN